MNKTIRKIGQANTQKFNGPVNSQDNKTTIVMWAISGILTILVYGACSMIDVKSTKKKKESKSQEKEQERKKNDQLDIQKAKEIADIEVEKHRRIAEDKSRIKCAESERLAGLDRRDWSRTVSANLPVSMNMAEVLSSPSVPTPELIPGLIYQNETVIVAARRKTGKTIALTQIGLAMASGRVYNLHTGNEETISPVNVLYLDSETFPDDYKRNYGHFGYDFSKLSNFHLVNTDGHTGADILSIIDKELDKLSGPTVVFLDNLSSMTDPAQPNIIGDFLNEINLRKRAANSEGRTLSFILAMHTKKEYDITKPITDNDIEGSNYFGKVPTSCFVLEETNLGSNFRMLRMNYSRKRELIEDVFLLKRHQNYPYARFEFCKVVNEEDYLPEAKTSTSKKTDTVPTHQFGKRTPEIENKIKELMAQTPRPKDKDILVELQKLTPRLSQRTWANWKKEMGYTKQKGNREEEC